jgi:hypothetical protein
MMIEKFFTQSEWLGINFLETNLNLNPKTIANSYFYSQFYKVLEEKYNCINQLPKEWLKGKRDTAKALSEIIKKNSKILSYGCGIGVVEKYLIEEFNYSPIFGFDIAKPNKLNYSSNDFIQIKRIEEIKQVSFDCIYLCQVLYAFDKNETILLLQKLNSLLKVGGLLILIHSSIADLENGISKIQTPKNRIISKIRRMSKRILGGEIENKASEQGWGYARNNEFYELLITASGFNTIAFLPLAKQSFVVCRK